MFGFGSTTGKGAVIDPLLSPDNLPPVPPGFVEDRTYQDRCWSFCLAVHLVLSAVIGFLTVSMSADSVATLHELLETEKTGAFSYTHGLFLDMLPLAIGSIVVCGLLARCWYGLLRSHPRKVLYFSVMAVGLIMVAVGALIFWARNGALFEVDEEDSQEMFATGLAIMIVGPCVGCLVFFCKDRMSLAAKVVTEAVEVVDQNPRTLLYSAVGSIVQAPLGLVGVWLMYRALLIGTWNLDDEDPLNERFEPADIAVLLVLFHGFNLFWMSQVGSYIVHFTIAGVAGKTYFDGPSANAARDSLRRAVTTSLGSLVFGALLLTIVRIGKALTENKKRARIRNQDEQAALVAEMMLIFLTCIFKMLYHLIYFFNKYAIVYMAIKGENLCDSAKFSYHMFRRNLLTTAFVDEVIGASLVVVHLFAPVGVAGALCAVVYLNLPDAPPEYLEGGHDIQALLWFGAVCWVLGSMTVGVFTNVVSSAAAGIFVCFAIDVDSGVVTNQKVNDLYKEIDDMQVDPEDPDRTGMYLTPWSSAEPTKAGEDKKDGAE